LGFTSILTDELIETTPQSHWTVLSSVVPILWGAAYLKMNGKNNKTRKNREVRRSNKAAEDETILIV
jgi:hypothetical protein